jgi:hypothetical protein
MVRGSQRYAYLRHRMDELRSHLLFFLPAPPLSKTTYSAQELDLTRSYIVLAHAEIEAYCEDLVVATINRARQPYTAKQKITPVLRKIIAYYIGKHRKSWSEVTLPSSGVVDAAFESYTSTIRENHGVKRENLERLLYPLGVAEPSLNATWLAQMDSFGSNRGAWAHRSIRAINPPDPSSELATVNQLLQGLLQVDRLVSRLH